MRKSFTIFSIFAAIITFVFIPVNTNATTYTITVNSNFFSPASQNVLVGDTVHFQWVSGSHTTTCDPGTLPGTSYPAGFFGWDANMNSGSTDYYVLITQPGTYVYGCQPHWPAMQGTITATTGYKYWYGINGGGDGTSWADPLNWLDGVAPVSTDTVKLTNSFVTSTYIVTLPTGAVNTNVKRLIIEPTAPNYVYLTLPSGNTNNPGLTVGDGVSGSYDFILKKNSVFTNSSGAAAGTGFAFAATSDSIQLQDSSMWVHNCTRGTSGIVQQLSKATNCNRGIWRFDVPTASSFSLTASGISYGSLQLYGLAAGGGLLSKKYVRAGGTALTIRGDYYIEEHAYDSTAMTNNLNIWGNYTCYGKIVYALSSTQTINFNGTSLQTITCDGLTSASFTISRSVTFNNAAGFYIASPFYSDSVIMTQGNINSGGGAWLGVGYDANNPGFLSRTGGIVTGQMERWYLAGAVSDSLSFPVGTSSVLKEAKVRFSTAPTTAGRIGMKFIDNGTGGSDLTPFGLVDGGYSITRRSDSYWLMTGTLLTGGLIDVALDGNGQAGITDPQNMRVIWSNDGTTFTLQGSHKDGNNSTARRTGISFYFSNFYLGGNSSFNPLPVELNSFAASTIKNEVILDWVTGHETNNNMFEVQRANVNSGKTGDFTTVGTVPSRGNSNLPQAYRYSDKNLSIGTYAYRLKQIDHNGNFEYFALNNEVNVGQPKDFIVSQNYPNPFNPTTNIDYEIPFDGLVKIIVFDNLGREVKTLVNSNVNAGYYRAEFNAAGLPSGIYFYRVNLTSGSQKFEKVSKMMLVK
ncbi:MAG: T9SS type A sorting domain-containing protein [Bacteroidetes bacterium]|nr:T9SS type A sorting domain-containing protein [Bacteroidota bacterium]